MRGSTGLTLALLCLAGCEGQSPPARSGLGETELRASVAAALADPAHAEQQPSDATRKPLELVTFAGLRPGDKVLDLIPGSGYWTRIFSRIVGPDGRVYGVWPEDYARYARSNVTGLQALAATSAFANVRVDVQSSNVLTAPEPLDLVWTSQNYHDYPAEFMGQTDPSILNKAVFAMLKPGGIYIVIDHESAPGAGMRDVEPMHRIDPETVKQQAIAAGFEFVGRNDALDNPADGHDVAVFDPSIRGRTDRFALKFRKPR